MSAPTPEEFTPDFVQKHAANLGLVTTLINLHGIYMAAEGGSQEEADSERALNEHIETLIDLGPDTSANVILALSSIITETGDEAKVQEWFDNQATQIRAVLGG